MSPATSIVLHPQHPDYPLEARALTRPFDSLHLKGRLPRGRGIAIVGTRAATEPAVRFTRELAATLARAGVVIWSGGAAGIDAAAHRGALDASGVTVVVMGTGFDQTYPAEHRELFAEVLEAGGAWLSPFSPQETGARWRFLLRNELLAAMSEAVLVVQAPLRSGARSTAAAARRQGKPVWVVPGAPWDALSRGALEEMRLGGLPVHSASQILSLMGKRATEEPPQPTALPADLSAEQRAVIEAVRSGCRHPDHICDRAGLTAATVAAALLTLTLRCILLETSDGLFELVKA